MFAEPTQSVQGVDMVTGGADGVGVIPDVSTEALASELSYVPKTGIDVVTGGADGIGIIQDTVSNTLGSTGKSTFSNYTEKAFDLLKKRNQSSILQWR